MTIPMTNIHDPTDTLFTIILSATGLGFVVLLVLRLGDRKMTENSLTESEELVICDCCGGHHPNTRIRTQTHPNTDGEIALCPWGRCASDEALEHALAANDFIKWLTPSST